MGCGGVWRFEFRNGGRCSLDVLGWWRMWILDLSGSAAGCDGVVMQVGLGDGLRSSGRVQFGGVLDVRGWRWRELQGAW